VQNTIRAIVNADQFNVRHFVINILIGIGAIGWGSRLCYLGFRKEPAPTIVLTDDPKLGKSAHRLYGIGLVLCGLIAIGSEVYDKVAK
jgi:hypothetical protein